MTTHTLLWDTVERIKSGARRGELAYARARCGVMVTDGREDARGETPSCEDCRIIEQQDEDEDAVNPLLRATLR